MDVGLRTDKGVRRTANEDACFVMSDEGVFVVADGVGGENSGDLASSTAVKKVADYICRNPLDGLKSSKVIRDYFFRCIEHVNFTVFDLSKKNEENKGMATTLVAAYVAGSSLYIMNIGDSRAYICRGGKLTQITEDHTYVNTLVKKGLITEEEAKTHENRNMITKAVGAEENVEPDFFKVSTKVGDIVLICTDGLYGEIEETEMTGIISGGLSMQEACDRLVDRANENGGHDNITVVCIKIMEEDIK